MNISGENERMINFTKNLQGVLKRLGIYERTALLSPVNLLFT